MSDDTTPRRPQPDEIRLNEPTDRESIDLGEGREGTDPFPVVNVAPEEVQPSLSADPSPEADPSGAAE